MGAAAPLHPPGYARAARPGAPPRLRSRCAMPLRFAPRPSSGPGPGGLWPPPVAAWALASTRAHTRYCVRRCGRGLRPSALSARFLRRARAALAAGPLPLRASGPARAARPRFAAPVRRLAPSALFGPRRGRASPCRPPFSRAPPFAASFLRPSSGRRWPRLPSGPPALCCGLPPRCSGCPCVGWAWPVRSAWPRGGSAAGPLRGFGPGGLPPRPPCGPCGPLFSPSGAGAFWLRARACPRLLSASRCLASSPALHLSVGSPLRPSRPRRPRWGLRGSVRPPALGLPPRRCAAPLRVRLLPLAPQVPHKSAAIMGHSPHVTAIPPHFHCPQRLKAALAAGPVAPGLDPLRCRSAGGLDIPARL